MDEKQAIEILDDIIAKADVQTGRLAQVVKFLLNGPDAAPTPAPSPETAGQPGQPS